MSFNGSYEGQLRVVTTRRETDTVTVHELHNECKSTSVVR